MEVDNSLFIEFQNLNRESSEFSKKCSTISDGLNSGDSNIVQLVEQLGPFLISTSPNNRELGIWILNQILQNLHPNILYNQQLNFIYTFYADRLKDHHQVIPAVLYGILTLTKFSQFPEGVSSRILTALFQNISCQQQQQADRYNIYKIFNILLEKNKNELCNMGLDFVYGVIAAVDGERDPKNLIFLFEWFPKFLKIVDLKHLTEEAFEVLACYFPVDFKAPPQDTNTITREKLADSLAPCLTAISQFSQFCLPLALEKLDSSLEIAKLDALQLLRNGCLSFEISAYVQHITEIWSTLQRELFNTPKEELESACLATLTAVIEKITPDASLNRILKDISDTVKRNLIPDSKLFKPSAQLLLHVAKASPVASSIIINEIAPILINTYNITTTPSHKATIMHLLIQFYNLYNNKNEEEMKTVPYLCLKATIDENVTLQSVGFENLGYISGFLTDEVRQPLYRNLKQMIITINRDNVRQSMLFCLQKLARFYAEEIKKYVFDIEEIPENALYLEAIITVAPFEFFTNYSISTLLEFKRRPLALVSMRKLLENCENHEKIHSIFHERQVIGILVDWAVEQVDDIDQSCLDNLSYILQSLVGSANCDKQQSIIDNEIVKILTIRAKCQIFISLLFGLLCRLRPEVNLNYDILKDLTQVALQDNDFESRAAQLLANLINKCGNNEILENYLNEVDSHQGYNLVIFTWLTKALVTKNHPRGYSWTNQLIEMLGKDQKVANAFRIIQNDNIESLSVKCYCNRWFLYQQKFFTIVSNKLNENYQRGCTAYLLTIGYLIEQVPRAVVLIQFKKILKLIILCMDECQSGDILTVLLDLILNFIKSKEPCIMDNFDNFLTRFIKLSEFENCMKVRILALQCLQQYTYTFPLYKLLPHKAEILKILGKSIDDKKRLVRREAVEARSLWFMLDAPIVSGALNLVIGTRKK